MGCLAGEVDQLLSVILTYGGFLRNALPPGDPLRSDAHEVCHAAERAALLVRQMQAVTGLDKVQPSAVNINLQILDMEPVLARILGRDMELRTVLNPGLCWALAPPGVLQHSLLQLAILARDGMPHGGTLTFTTTNVVTGETPALQQRPHVELGLVAEGRGLEAAGGLDAQRIAALRELVGPWEGLVDVHVGPGDTVSLRLYLPSAPAPVANLSRPLSVAGRGPPCSILLVDAEETARRAYRGLLERHGHVVLEAASGEEAAQHALAHPNGVDMVIVDGRMQPGALARMFSALQQTNPRAQTLCLSTDGTTPDGLHAPVISKQSGLNELLRHVNQALDR